MRMHRRVIVLASGRGERFSRPAARLQAAGAAGRQHGAGAHAGAVRASGLPFHVEDAAIRAWAIRSPPACARRAMPAAGWCCRRTCRWCAGVAARVAAALAQACVVLPFYRARAGIPVGFGAATGARCAALSGAEGAAAIVRSAQPLKLDSEDEGIVTDIDTVDDLARRRPCCCGAAGELQASRCWISRSSFSRLRSRMSCRRSSSSVRCA
jgi:molybdenum cofactor cytidylyltransferase